MIYRCAYRHVSAEYSQTSPIHSA